MISIWDADASACASSKAIDSSMVGTERTKQHVARVGASYVRGALHIYYILVHTRTYSRRTVNLSHKTTKIRYYSSIYPGEVDRGGVSGTEPLRSTRHDFVFLRNRLYTASERSASGVWTAG